MALYATGRGTLGEIIFLDGEGSLSMRYDASWVLLPLVISVLAEKMLFALLPILPLDKWYVSIPHAQIKRLLS